MIGYTHNSTKQDIYILNGTNNDIKKCISLDAYQLKYANIDSTTDTLYTISYSSNGTGDDDNAEDKINIQAIDGKTCEIKDTIPLPSSIQVTDMDINPNTKKDISGWQYL